MKAPTRLELLEYAAERVRDGATRHEIVKEIRTLSEETKTFNVGRLSSRTESVCMGLREAIDLVEAAEGMVSR